MLDGEQNEPLRIVRQNGFQRWIKSVTEKRWLLNGVIRHVRAPNKVTMVNDLSLPKGGTNRNASRAMY